MRTIFLAAGCFWGAESFFQQLPGICQTEVGYINGKTEQTNYNAIKETDHAECVKISYDPNRIKLAEILDRFYCVIDPLSVNQQGADQGRQYRTGIYFETEDDLSERIARESLALLDESLGQISAIELEAVKNYVPAEEYHQNYLTKNPDGYCHINPKKALSVVLYPPQADEDELKQIKEKLDEYAYKVTQEQGTEAPHSHEYNKVVEPGIYVDIVGGQPLFSSDDKFDAGCGWPSFTMPITTDIIRYREDFRFMLQRTEVSALASNSHLGHVFEDGPSAKGGLRFCINGLSLRFVPLTKMRELGYARLLPYVEQR